MFISNISSLLLQTSRDISEMEREMDSLYESAGLFEVNVPDYKQLKACRKYAHVTVSSPLSIAHNMVSHQLKCLLGKLCCLRACGT